MFASPSACALLCSHTAAGAEQSSGRPCPAWDASLASPEGELKHSSCRNVHGTSATHAQSASSRGLELQSASAPPTLTGYALAVPLLEPEDGQGGGSSFLGRTGLPALRKGAGKANQSIERFERAALGVLGTTGGRQEGQIEGGTEHSQSKVVFLFTTVGKAPGMI